MSKVAVITGAGSGIGLETARAFLEAGYVVWGLGRSLPKLEAARAGLGDLADGRFLISGVDVADRGAVDAFFSGLEALDVLVVNHGICLEATLESPESDEVWDQTISINLNGAYNVIRAAAARIRDAGRIVTVSSGLGVRGRAAHQAYSASKHGLNGLTKSVALELAPRRITANAICPGWVATEMSAQNIVDTAIRRGIEPKDLRAEAESGIPIGRFVAPEECAAMILWLASEEAGAITGQAINISGGEF